MKADTEFEELAPWLVVLVTLAGIVVRVLLLPSKGMWLDETFSVWVASHAVGDLVQWTARVGQHPPLYYLLLHIWMAVNGNAAYYVRLLSALIGAATVPVIYLIGKRLSGAIVGFAAAVILAFSPFNIRYAQETRMYTLLTFNAAVAMYALVRLLSDSHATMPIGSQFREYIRAWRGSAVPFEPVTKREFSYAPDPRYQTGLRGWVARHHWSPIQAIETDLAWVAFMVFSAATMLTHNAGVLFPLAANVFVIGLILYQRMREGGPRPALLAPSISNWLKAQVGILLLWSPWLLAFARQAGGVYREFWMPAPTWSAMIEAIKSLLNAPTPVPGQTNQSPLIWVLFAVVLVLGVVYYRKKLSQLLFLVTLFAVPILAELIVSIRRPIFYDRTLIWISIPLFIMLAAGIAQLRFRPLVFLGLGVLVTLNLFSTSDYFRFSQRENWSDAAGYVAHFAEKEDLVLFNATWAQIPFDYYFKDFEDRYGVRVEKRGAPADLFESGVLEPKMMENDVPRLVSLLEGRKRAWLVYSHDWYTDPEKLVPQTLAANMKLTRQRDFYGGTVQLYEAP
jgi:mannosyltransferase